MHAWGLIHSDKIQWPPVGILYGPVAVPTGSGRIFLVLTNVVKIHVVLRCNHFGIKIETY